jgi:hypothetical protein
MRIAAVLHVVRQMSRESVSSKKYAEKLIRRSSSYILVVEPVCRLAVVDCIYSCFQLHLRPDLRP